MLGDEKKIIKQENIEYSSFLVKEGKKLKEEQVQKIRQRTENALVQGLRLGKMSQAEAEYKMRKIWEHNSRQ